MRRGLEHSGWKEGAVGERASSLDGVSLKLYGQVY